MSSIFGDILVAVTVSRVRLTRYISPAAALTLTQGTPGITFLCCGVNPGGMSTVSGSQEAFPVCVFPTAPPPTPNTLSELPVTKAFSLPFQIFFLKEKLETFWLPLKEITKRKGKH